MNQDKINFFEFLTSLNEAQLKKYFAMLGPEESEYVLQVVRNVGTHLNLAIADFHDPVDELVVAKDVLSKFTLKGNI
jgi:hypothetical protein